MPTRSTSSPITTSAVNENRRPPLTTLATRLISTTRSLSSLVSWTSTAINVHPLHGAWDLAAKSKPGKDAEAFVAGGYGRDRGRSLAPLCSEPETAGHAGGGRVQNFSPPSRAASASAFTRPW